MQRRLMWVAWVAMLCWFGSAVQAAGLKTLREQFSYTYGYKVASNLRQQGLDVDTKVFVQALRDGLAGRKSRLTEAQMHDAIGRYQAQRTAELGAINAKAGKAFREKYRRKKGVKALPDGVLYRVLKSGTGAQPQATDTVTVNYSGKLPDGKEFDSSYRRGTPATFPANAVIKGWQEILPMMKTGAKWEVVIPPESAYGPSGRPPVIPPQATLVFQIELISIKK